MIMVNGWHQWIIDGGTTSGNSDALDWDPVAKWFSLHWLDRLLFHIFDFDFSDLFMPKLINSTAFSFFIQFILLVKFDSENWDNWLDQILIEYAFLSRAFWINWEKFFPTKFIFLTNTLVDNVYFSIATSLFWIPIVKCCQKYPRFFTATAYLNKIWLQMGDRFLTLRSRIVWKSNTGLEIIPWSTTRSSFRYYRVSTTLLFLICNLVICAAFESFCWIVHCRTS